jgi:hypothetical protein
VKPVVLGTDEMSLSAVEGSALSTAEKMVGAFVPGFHPGLPIVFPFGEFRSAEKAH